MRILRYLGEHKLACLIIFCLLVVQAFCDLSLPRFTSDIVDDVIQQAAMSGMTDATMSQLFSLGGKMLICAAVMVVTNILIALLASRTAASIARDLRERLFTQVISFSAREVDQFSAASLITRGTNDIQLIQMIEVILLRMVLYAPILAVGGICMVASTNISMGWVIALSIVCILVVIGMLMAITMPKFKIMQDLVDRVNLVSREILTGLPVIRAFGREAHEEQRFGVANTNLFKTQLFTNRIMAFMMPAMSLVMNITSCLIVWIGGHYVADGVMGTGDLIAFITYSMIVIISFLIIGMVAVLLPRANVAAGRVDEVLAAQSSIVDPAQSQLASVGEPAPGARIAFEDVSFRYNPESADVLSNVSFTAESGQTTAIIGATGCGKSTIIKLIERFYDVTEGHVRIDGVDVREMTQAEVRGQLGYAPQAAFLFSGTIGSNVTYADGAMPAEQARMAVEVAQAAEFVDAKQEGMDAAISQGGSNVSGGQRQRLAIARALATNARAYLFDDSFSALDYKTDAQLRADLNERLSGKTVIIVAQRIATIMSADKIIVLDEGRIVGQGTHAQLLAECDEYRAIAQTQLSEAELAKGGAR